MDREGRVRVMADVPPDLKAKLDKHVHWGLRNDFLSAVLERVVEGLEKDERGILVGLIIAGKVQMVWKVEDAIK